LGKFSTIYRDVYG
jgi:hypothetical protein